MSGPSLQIRFDGGDADKHVVDMKYYALALQGAEEIISDGMIILAHRRIPRPRDRAPILVKAREAKAGSHLTPADLGEAFQLLQLGLPIITDIGAEFLYNWVKAVLAKFSGNPSDLQIAMSRMLELSNAHLIARDKSEERMQEERRMAHEERMLSAQTLSDAINALGSAAEKFAAPVGPNRSVLEAGISTGHKNHTARIGTVEAEKIRESNKVIWEKSSLIDLETDGFKFHTNGLSVRNPEGEGFMMATVKDPQFSDDENQYTDAAQKRAIIRVRARKGRRNGVLARLEIMEFEGVIAA